MRTELFIISFILTAVGLTLVFVFLNPFGFVLDGLGFMLFMYAIFAEDDSDEYESSRFFDEDKYHCGYYRFFGSPRCDRKEEFVNAEPCQKYLAKS